MPDAQDVYAANVRLPSPAVGESDEWSEEDTRELTAFSLQYAVALYPEEEGYIASMRHLTCPL